MNYNQIKKLPNEYIKQKINQFLNEDIPSTDITTENIYNENKTIYAQIEAGEDLVFCGKDIVLNCFSKKCEVVDILTDGNTIQKNKIIGKIKGPAKEILQKERTLLNIIQRLSAIATKTKEISQQAQKYNIKILDTRKTTPGLRLFEKYAVKTGGGWNHRMDLSSGVLIKDNHIIAAGGIKEAINKIKKTLPNLKIEIEVDFFEQIQESLNSGADAFLLDNMSAEETKKAVEYIKNFNPKIFIEASGGITKKTIYSYLKTGVDAISMGEITHSISNSDIKLTFS